MAALTSFAMTPHAVGRIAPAILASVICVYLAVRQRNQRASFWLALYFGFLTAFNLSYMAGYSLNTEAGGYAWYGACVIALAGLARVQFAYNFPGPRFERERKIVLWLTLILAGAAIGDYLLRAGTQFEFLFPLHAYGARYSSFWIPLHSFLCFAWAIAVSVRIALALLPEHRTLSRAWKDSDFRGVAYLALISIAELCLNGVYFLGYGRIISSTLFAAVFNAALLFIFASYVMVYASVPAARTGFLSRLTGISLVGILVITNFLGILFIERDLLHYRAEKSSGCIVDQSACFTRPAADGIPEAAAEWRGFLFFTAEGKRYAAVETPGGMHVFPYEEFRARLGSISSLAALGLAGAAILVIVVFPLLFRTALLLPLRYLLDDLRKTSQTQKSAADGDEISAIREQFRLMSQLLQETRKQIPDIAPHLQFLENAAALEPARIHIGGRTLVFRSRTMNRVIEQVEQAREYRYPVLITGETGTGKELAARLLQSETGQEPFVAVNCAALPDALWESEIFGHKKGAFTDARSDRRGRIKEAEGGILFFDEIGEMPLPMQAKMLRLLQENQYSPLGSEGVVQSSCRFVFATNRDLDSMVKERTFREDLLYRIRVFHVHLPPLRERPEDIPDLVQYFVDRFASEHAMAVPSVEPEAMAVLVRYPWPGNIREVENAVVRAMTSRPERLSADRFAEFAQGAGPGLGAGRIDLDSEILRYSRSLIEQALSLSGGNKTRAAELLGLKRTTLRYRMRELGLDG